MKRSPRWSVGKLSALQRKFEGSRFGEAALSGLVAVILLAAVVPQLPEAEITRRLTPLFGPIAMATGINQYWGMFSPDPPDRSNKLEVHVTMSDGSDRMWTLRRDDWWIGGVRSTHWHGAMHAVIGNPQNRERFAQWVVNELTEPSERAVHVQMIVRSAALSPPGGKEPTTEATTIYDARVVGTQ
jgi:hypothetical protein